MVSTPFVFVSPDKSTNKHAAGNRFQTYELSDEIECIERQVTQISAV